jgi:hypothetical protein
MEKGADLGRDLLLGRQNGFNVAVVLDGDMAYAPDDPRAATVLGIRRASPNPSPLDSKRPPGICKAK